ncbi:MAG: YdbL family protein [Pseudomonadota bacterium]
MRKHIIAFALMSVSAWGGSAVAASKIVEDAKDRCIVGEEVSGYLGIVEDAAVSTELRREIRDINQQRKSYYADLAARNGVAIDVAAKLTAEKLIADADAGECVRNENGEWIKI